MNNAVRFLGTDLANRSVLASGILGVTVSSLRRACREGAGLVTSKSVGKQPRKGHHGPVVFDWGGGLINAVGLSNPGIDEFVSQFEKKRPLDFPLAVSIFGGSEQDFSDIAAKLEQIDFTFLEINISCPNVRDEYGLPFSFTPEITAAVTERVKRSSSKPLIVKLSPNTPNIVRVAAAAVEAGADALCIMNTAGPGMVIDVHTAQPVLGNKTGGVSGTAVLPLTVRCVYDVYREISVPIIGTGGISTWRDAVQVMMAGATLYGVGSAVYKRGIGVFREIEQGIEWYVKKNRLQSAARIVGLSHKTRRVFFHTGAHDGAKPHKAAVPHIHGRHDWNVLPLVRVRQAPGSGVKTLFFQMPDEAQVPSPGQFYMLWIPGVDQKPYSVSWLEGSTVGFSLTKRGPFSERLFDLKPKDPVGLLGPLGRGFLHEGSRRPGEYGSEYGRYLLVGGGIGTAPLLFAAKELAVSGRDVCIVAGGKDNGSVAWIEPFCKTAGTTVYYCTEDGSLGEKGMITDHLPELVSRLSPDFALLCGPELFLVRAIEILREKGVRGEAGLERMMKCGIGLCGSCAVDPTGDRVCVEGPVFGFEEIARIDEFGKYHRDESGSIERL
jgi:dihydroorotate dehydrogenase (NAD+) catalytic subunit